MKILLSNPFLFLAALPIGIALHFIINGKSYQKGGTNL
jgi:hypothetical protein